ncbi:ATP-binding protein [Paenibacillus pasadenensis]|uniref:ATP-binding protein n=1 Tax=Paenibacillus pasadenensis TaxID=217090 RepID=UPI00203D5175|nr:ATP-binding protein [Paenibacillus pasadenensis]MCM3749884.1 ATP-binding protein [Paenibacillus pasadenensis]
MQAIRKRYFPALAEYIRSGSEASLYQATELGKMFQSIGPEEIIAIHEECMRNIVLNVDSEEALELYSRSFLFLIELMVSYRFRYQPERPADDRYIEMRELLSRSYRSFERVKSKYENVLQHMDSGIALFDTDGIVTFMNLQMAKFLDVPRKTLIGCSILEIMRHSQLSRLTRRLLIRLYREIIVRRNKYFEFQDSNGRHLLITATYGDQLDGEYLISMKDVSEYKQIEQTAYQNDKLAMLGKIAAAIAHEIRNPLTSIRGFIQLLRPVLVDLGKEEYAKIMVAEIDRANDIIYEFLNSSKPTAPMKQTIRLTSLLKEVSLLSESEALMHNCQIYLESYEADLQVSIDVKQIKQVVLNLFKNAMDAIAEMNGERPGRIDVILKRKTDFAEITIKDNGKGMDRATLNRLFDPFFTTKESGTGLGLSVSYRIIRNHGGTIRVTSVAREGTSFMIYLPIVEQKV